MNCSVYLDFLYSSRIIKQKIHCVVIVFVIYVTFLNTSVISGNIMKQNSIKDVNIVLRNSFSVCETSQKTEDRRVFFCTVNLILKLMYQVTVNREDTTFEVYLIYGLDTVINGL